jgi:hypothetical protein
MRADVTAVKSQVTQMDSLPSGLSSEDGDHSTVADLGIQGEAPEKLKESRRHMPDDKNQIRSTDSDDKELRQHKATAMMDSRTTEVTSAIDEAVQKVEYLAAYITGIKGDTMRIVDSKTDRAMRALDESIEKIKSMRNDVERAKNAVIEMTGVIQMKAITLSNQAFEKYGFDDPLTTSQVGKQTAPASNRGSVSGGEILSNNTSSKLSAAAARVDADAAQKGEEEKVTTTATQTQQNDASRAGSHSPKLAEEQDSEESIVALDAQWEHMLADVIRAQEDAMMTAENTLKTLSHVVQVLCMYAACQ